MIRIYVYDKASGLPIREDYGLAGHVMHDIKDGTDFTLVPPPDYDHVWRWVEDKWEELLPINNPDIKYDDKFIWDSELNQWVECPELSAYKHLEEQELMWERIKERRLQAVTSGVYVESVDKVFHTDATSVIQYNNIGNMIALDNFEPIQWKVKDNSWITLTKELFKELQIAMVQNTNRIYQVAEVHKAKMLELDNPEEYDYSTGWNNTDALNKESQ